MPIARITPIGGDLYHVHVMEPGHPDQGLPGGGTRPGQLPSFGGGQHPDQGLPGGRFPGRPVDPGFGVGGGMRPDNTLPGQGGIPDHELPEAPPPQLAPGWTLVLVRGPYGRWQYAAINNANPPPKPLPEPLPPDAGTKPIDPDAHPDQGLPGQPPHVSNRPPGTGMPPHPSGQPVPPQPTPQQRR